MPSQGGMSDFDVVIIGAGPAGETAAELGGILGYSVALVERDVVGGTVVTSGGAPTKTFREAAVYFGSFEKEKIYGVALSAPAEVAYPAIRARAREVSEQLRQATLGRIRERGVHLIQGEARLEADHTVLVRAGDGTQTRLRAERVIIATGSRPLRPPGIPFEDPRVADSDARRARRPARPQRTIRRRRHPPDQPLTTPPLLKRRHGCHSRPGAGGPGCLAGTQAVCGYLVRVRDRLSSME